MFLPEFSRLSLSILIYLVIIHDSQLSHDKHMTSPPLNSNVSWTPDDSDQTNFSPQKTTTGPQDYRVLDKELHTSKIMKAIRVSQFGGPEVLKIETNVPIPKPGNSEVLIRVHAVGINPVETYIRAGTYARKPSLPFIPGNDCAGVIEEVGSEVTGFKKGDRVFTSASVSGAYAEYTVSLASSTHPLHDDLTFVQGAAIPTPYRTAYRAIYQRGWGKPGETVLVHGASGGVGVAAVQFARASGMRVLGTAGTEKGVQLVKQAGADDVYNHRETGYLDRIKTATEGRGIDLIVENASHINLGRDLPLLARRGRVVIVGSRGTVEINPRDLMSREAMVSGVMLFGATEEEKKEIDGAIQGGMAAGWLRPIAGKQFPLEKAPEAHTDIISGEGALGKMVLTVS